MKPDFLQTFQKVTDALNPKRKRRKRSENELLGLPYRAAMPLICAVGFLAGAILFLTYGLRLASVSTAGEPFQMECTFSLAFVGVFVVFGVAVAIAAAAFVAPLEETWHRFAVLAVAAGFLITGFWSHTIHKIEIHTDRFVVRGPLSPIAATYQIGAGNKVEVRTKRWHNWGRVRIRNRVYYIRPDGSETILSRHYHRPSTWLYAAPHLVRGEKVFIPNNIR